MKGRLFFTVSLCLGLAFSAGAVAPIIKTQPVSTTVSLAATARFSVLSTNTSPLTYQWQFKATNIAGATDSTLVVDNVQTNQAGSYTVLVSSPTATVKSSVATLKVVAGTLVRLHVVGAPGDGNMDVQLFDYDKPATVQNFIHFIQSGAYTNAFFDRLIPGHVLQAGDYSSLDQTGTNSFIDTVQTNINLYDIYSYWVEGLRATPLISEQVDNEFARGARVSNEYGTLAMGQSGGDPDSASSSWYINLTNNNSGTNWNLDVEYELSNNVVVPIPNVGYTVFGRVVNGTAVLDYFNGLSKPANGIFDSSVAIAGLDLLTDLPVRYQGTNLPADADMYFIDFTFLTVPPLDTVLPGLIITSPAPNARVHGTLADPRTITFYGTASDNFGVARVFVEDIGPAGTLANNAQGTTNWSITIPGIGVGLNGLIVFSQDGRGNITKKSYTFLVTTPLIVNTNGYGTVTAGMNGAFLDSGSVYSITATPKVGNLFSNWTFGGQTISAPTFSFAMSEGVTMTANFMSNSLPGGITFVSPLANGKLSNSVFTITGKIKAGVTLTNIDCQFYSSVGQVASHPAVISGSTWSFTGQLAPGTYTVTAIASDVNGRKTLITESFSILTPLHVIKVGQGTLTPNRDGQYLSVGTTYTITAAPASSQWLFATWSDGVGTSTNPVATFGMYSNLTLTATFAPNYFPNVTGTYNGLFSNPTNTTAASSGAFSIIPTATGAFSGKLLSLGKTFAFSGKFDYTGNCQVTVTRAGTNTVTLFLSLDLTNGTGTVSGTATNANWTASVLGYKAVTKLGTNAMPVAGSFAMTIPGNVASTNTPGGDSYATFTTSAAGALTLTGKLADNLSTAVVAETTGVSTNGIWPFFISLANGTEVIFGWQTFTTPTNCSGSLQWIKGATAATSYSPAGFALTTETATASKVVPPPAGATYQIRFSGGTLTAPLANIVTVNTAHQFVVSGTPADRLTLTLTAATGAFTGTFINPDTNAKLTFYGVFTDPTQLGSGFILDSNHQTGDVSFSFPP